MAPAFITTFIEDWKSLTNWCKGLLVVCIIQTIILIGFSVASMVLFSYRLSLAADVNKEIAYGLLVIVSSVFFIYFAFDAVMNENKFEMVAFAAVSILLTVRIIYMFYANYIRSPAVWEGTWLTLAVMVVVCIFQILLIIFFIRAWKDFGWKLYKTVGANKNLIAYFRHYQIFLSLLKVDLQFGVSLVMLSGFFLFTATQSVALWLNVAVIVVSFAWAVLGWQMIIRELVIGMVLYFAFAVAEPAYVLYKVISFYAPSLFPASQAVDCTYTPCILFTVSGVFAIIVRGFVVGFSVVCMKNFGRGMKKVFGTDDSAPDAKPGAAGGAAGLRPGSLGSVALTGSPRASVQMTMRSPQPASPATPYV